MISNRINKIVNRLITNKEQTIAAQRSIVELLATSGLGEYLRSRGSIPAFDPSNDVVIQANKGAFSAGYNACLDDLIGFIDEVVVPLENASKMPFSSYGAHEAMKDSGRFTQEEIDKMKVTPL